MHEFYRANARAISAVTIKDALYGEIEDSVAKVEHIEDLLSINEVNFRVHSARTFSARRRNCACSPIRSRRSPTPGATTPCSTAWSSSPRSPATSARTRWCRISLVFRHDAFWADHFGGVFVFHDARKHHVICRADAPGFRKARPWQVSYIDIEDYETLYGFLARTRRIELPQASGSSPPAFINTECG